MYGTLYVRSAMQYWRSVTVLFVLGALLTGLAVSQRAPEYRVHVQLLATFDMVQRAPAAGLDPVAPAELVVRPGPETDLSSAVAVAKSFDADLRLIEARVRMYAQKATGVAVTTTLRESLRLPYSADELGTRIATSSPLDSTLIDIFVRDTDRARVVTIGAAVAAELIRLAAAEKPREGEPTPLRIQLSLVGTVPVVATAVATPWLRYLLGWTVGGLALSVGLAALRVLLHRRRQNLLDWTEEGWHRQVARTRSFVRRANERFWGPGWR